MAETLRPCPFCGGTAGVDKTNYYFEDSGERAMSSFVVSCRACGMKTAQHRTEDGAVMAWNRRKERTCRVVRSGEPSATGVPRERRCSECGGMLTRFGSYCPNCGARVAREGI